MVVTRFIFLVLVMLAITFENQNRGLVWSVMVNERVDSIWEIG
jgi:hypothetical protein